MKLGLAREARFPLRLRIPHWATGARITINGQPQPSPKPGEFHRIERVFHDGDSVELDLPMRVRVTAGHNGLASVFRGPLLYSLKLGERWQKYRGEDPHAFWEVHPTTPWNYALVLDPADPAASFRVETTSHSGQPFKHGPPPVQLKVKARRLPHWKMENECPAVIAAETGVARADRRDHVDTLRLYEHSDWSISDRPMSSPSAALVARHTGGALVR